MSQQIKEEVSTPRTTSDKKAFEKAFENSCVNTDGNETDTIGDEDIDEVSEDDMTVKLDTPNQTDRQEAEGVMPTLSEFSLNSGDFGRLDIQPLNINLDFANKVADWEMEMVDKALEDEKDAQKWKDFLNEEAENVEVIIPKVEWSDCDSDGLFSEDEDEDEINLMDDFKPVLSRKVKKVKKSEKKDDINPITNRKRVKIVDSDEESDNKLVQLKPKAAVDLTKEVAKAKADLVDTNDESKGKKARQLTRWCFTMNNPDLSGEELAEKLKSTDNVKGFVFQLEEGASGTKHFQGYIEFTKVKRMTEAKKLLGNNPHMEEANGDKESNLKYCTKEEGRKEGPWIWGTCTETKGQGKRSDLNDFAMMIEEYGGITDEVMQAFPGHALQFRRQAKERTEEIVMKLAKEKEKAWWMEQKRLKDAGLPYLTQRQMKCIMLFGPTAVGKTTHVKLETLGMGEDLYEKAGNNKWYPGYAGEKHMLVDEMTTGFCEKDIRNFNKMTNLGMNVQEVKGSHVLLEVETAWFTTNKHPLHIWDEVKESGTYKAFIRRFDEVHWWNDQKKLVILKNPGQKDDAEDKDQWKKDYTRWMSFWNGKQLDDEHRTIVPGQEVKNYFTFGCNQPQSNILDMLMF